MKHVLQIFLFFCLPILAMAQTQLPDSVTAVTNQDCCFTFTVKNRNSKQSPINDFHIIVLTGGVDIRTTPTGPTAPTDWVVTSANADSVVYTMNPGSILRAGQQQGGFGVCFNNAIANFTIRWRTTYNGNEVSTGTMQLSCPLHCDVVTPTPLGNCCFEWSVTNNNSPHTAINDFHLRVLTNGVTISTTNAPPGWNAASPNNQTVNFVGGAAGGAIVPGQTENGFQTCYNMPPTGISSFRVEWITTFNGKVICADTVDLQCAPYKCDSVGYSYNGDCCFNFVIKNRNTTQIPISDFHILVITPGVTVRPTPTTPPQWSISNMGSTQVDFVTSGLPVVPGQNLSGFNVCFDFASGVAVPFKIIWKTTQPGAVICEDTLSLQCSLLPRCDSVSVTPLVTAQCCYDVTLKNRHTPAGPLNDFHLKIVTPGAVFRPGSVSGPWATTQSTPTEVTWAVASNVLGPGLDQSGFKFCIDRDPNAPFAIQIYWESTLDGKVVCHDTMRVVCDFAQTKCDSVRVRALDNCCFNFAVLNRHTPAGPLNDFHILSATPGVQIKLPPTAPAGWSITNATSTSVSFATGNNFIPSGGAQGGFVLCFDTIPASGVFVIKWRTTFDGKVVCFDSLFVRCNEDPPACDSVETNKALDDCCYDIIIKNRHHPSSPINDAHFKIITPGVTFRPTPGAPTGWTISNFNPTLVSFITQANQILPNGNQSGFVLCFDRSPNVLTTFKVVWQTTIDGNVICEDTLEFDCRPKPTPCDSVQINKNLDKCCFDFIVKNRHNGPIDDVHFKVITPGVTILPTPGAPFGWGIGALSATGVYFKTTSMPIPAGADLAGFRICFNVPPTAPPTFQVVWQTTLQGKVICEDTIRIQCQPTSSRCDSVSFKRTNNDDCCFDFTVHNLHTPPGPINDWHVQVLTPGVTIRPTPVPPAGWTISGFTPTQVEFKVPGGGIASGGSLSGFRICFDKIQPGQIIKLRWCTTLDGQIICCDTLQFECVIQPQPRCDSVSVKPRPDCCFEMTLHNVHLPASPVNDWHLRVLTPGVTIRPTPAAPTNWSISNFTSTQVDFKEVTGAGIPHGGAVGGFIICFDVLPPNQFVTLQWCSTLNGQIICCDTIEVKCEQQSTQCDRVSAELVDTARCCWNLKVFNIHQPNPSNINDFHLRVITTGVTIYTTIVQAPTGWTFTANPTSVNFVTQTSPIMPSQALNGFIVCFNSGQIGNQPFNVVWETTLDGVVICRDTLRLHCPKPTAVEELPGPKPSSYLLHQNYPNPFNPMTIIEFDLAESANTELVVFDASGRTNVILVKEYLKPGRYQVPFDASTMPSGTYFYRLRARDFVQTKTMTLVK